jgi:SpoVK/Ycf46/Vps4 family AAA+-type ATPase
MALQIAAHEARLGHSDLAFEIRQLVDKAKARPKVVVAFPNELQGLIISDKPEIPIEALVLNETMLSKVERIILEFRQQSKLKSYGLAHRRKILLSGAPGTGKTMTARVLATELSLPLHSVQMDRLVTKFMGETSAKLRQIFDRIKEVPGVYLFDEMDAIGGERGASNDVGEMRRVLTSFLQFIEGDPSDNIILAATNNLRLLDRALFRRFDDILQYELPGLDQRIRLIQNLLSTFIGDSFSVQEAAQAAKGLSHAEINLACQGAIKNAILSDRDHVCFDSFLVLLRERHAPYRVQEE